MKFIVKTLYGLEDVLAAELREFGVSGVKPVNRAVSCSGSRRKRQ
jgi:23S rRNA G2445 N2-methylase RlmL